jgi:DNA-directed RNA polymerase specialized sigma54-like protein
MAETTLGTIDELLEGALEDADDSEMRYKLKSARQLVQVLQQRQDSLGEAVHDAVDDEEIMSSLRDLGYID